MGNPVDLLTAGPAGPSAGQDEHTDPMTATERLLAEVLADVVRVERVPVESHFFEELGADSLMMAQFCARLRKRADLPPVSMKDTYRHPTIRVLARALAAEEAAPVAPPAPAEQPTRGPAEVAEPVGRPQYFLCGALQLLFFLGGSGLAALLAERGYAWISAGSGLLDFYLRSVLFGGASFLGLCLLPVVVKWVLIGRWKPQEIRIWSLEYVRFWVVRTLVRTNPLALFAGSPLQVLYLRALGAKIGRGVVILSRNVPVCTDLLTVGDGTVLRKDSYFTCYRARAGRIQTGPVTIGEDVLVSEATVLDIETSLGDGAQLGHASSLHAGQVVPDGQRWHGSPAQRTEVDYQAVAPAECGTLRRAAWGGFQLLALLFLHLPLVAGGVDLLLTAVPQFAAILASGSAAFTSWSFYHDAAVASAALLFGSALLGLLFAFTVPRLLSLALEPGRVYRLYGFHHGVQRVIARTTNLKFFTALLGDSSYIVHYLRGLGYDLSQVEQTGSNFGVDVKHESPYLSSVGSGTMVADGLSLSNADFSSTSFRVSRTSVGAHNFLGNNIVYPSQGRTGDDCLLATKVMVPVDGEVREGVGLLGSPSFEIPRSVQRDGSFDHLMSGDEGRRRLAAKNRYNLRTMGLSLLVQWIHLFGVVLIAGGAAELHRSWGAAAVVLALWLSFLFSSCYAVVLERAVARFRPLRPRFCSIYDPYFWWHERFWKFASPQFAVLGGTPFKNVLSRLLGVRLGRRVFDDGCSIPEKTLVTIGDGVALNAGSVVQCHSQEDGSFKSDRIEIGAGCTIGIGAWVHYGSTVGDGAVLAPDSFLMKGEEVPQHARWGGNPAREIRDDRDTAFAGGH